MIQAHRLDLRTSGLEEAFSRADQIDPDTSFD